MKSEQRILEERVQWERDNGAVARTMRLSPSHIAAYVERIAAMQWSMPANPHEPLRVLGLTWVEDSALRGDELAFSPEAQ